MNGTLNRKSLSIIVIVMSAIIWSCISEKKYKHDYLNPDLTAEARAKDLVSQMTLQEKVSQMRYDAPAIDRLGVPTYNWWNECLHGVARAGEATVFPQGIGMGATWDTDLMLEVATTISDEARAKYHKSVSEGKRGIYQGLTFWTPNINIFRDPRWGRGQETYGEDPYLTGRMAVNFIKGLQGDDEKYLKVVATAKHFAVHSGPEKSRHEDNYQTSNKDLHETYLPAFKAAIMEAKVQSVMCAYNRYRDEACCGSNLLLDSILRQNWGFDGYVVSDCWAINDFYFPDRHGVAKDAKEASALAVKSGTDLNCGNTYDPNLSEAVLAKLIDEKEVDVALSRLMSARMKLGMFDNQENVAWSKIPYEVVCSEKHCALSEKASREALVLLKNDNNMLPLSNDLKSIAVIGPNANTVQSLLGNYHGTSKNNITPLAAIKSKLPNAIINYAKGSDIAEGWPLLTPIASTQLTSGGKTGLTGEYFANADWSGVPSFTRVDQDIDFIWIQRPIKEHKSDTFSVRWKGQLAVDVTGKYRLGLRACNVGRLFVNGEKVIDFVHNHHPVMNYVDLDLVAGKSLDIQIDYYNFHADPQVQLLWARLGEDLLSSAIVAAKKSDVVVMCLGLNPDIEGEEMPVVLEGFDKGDRSDIQLPRSQRVLLEAIVKTGKPVVVVLMNGSALAINYAAANVPAILEAWYPGEFGGLAIADALFGEFSPGGKLPLTFYKSVEDLPDFKTYDMTNRTYKYFKGEPLFPFGHGLSYSKFTYDDFEINKNQNGGLDVSVNINNVGQYDAADVVQLYISMPEVPNSAKRTLVGFKRVLLSAGQSNLIKMTIEKEQLTIYSENGTATIFNGELVISIGGKQPGFNGVADANTTQVLVKNIQY